MFRNGLAAAVVGVCLLCVQIHGKCFTRNRLHPALVCEYTVDVGSIENMFSQNDFLSSIDNETLISIEVTKISDVTEIINTLKSSRVIKTNTLITFSDSKINSFPSELLTLEKVQLLSVSNNNIKSINLNILPYAKDLISLDLSYNMIEELETESATYTSTKKLRYMNLSHNNLERVPINCFYSVRDSLGVLELSYNQISAIDFYAFSNLLLLQTLRLSHNKLGRIGVFLYPLKNLMYLHLNHNLIKEINANNFARSTSLEKIDLSNNHIELIEDRSFGSLTALDNLNISNNSLTSIKEIMLRNNTHLSHFDFSFNNISYIEPGTFSSLISLNRIVVEHAFTMSIQEHVFAGVKVSELNFAGSTIRKIENEPFLSIGNSLYYLNLSSCGIREISETALGALTELVDLDLSNNELSEIAFRTTDLGQLSNLNLRNNIIREIKPRTFEHLINLIVLDLSNNEIQTLPAMTFKNLKYLEIFKLANNHLDSTIISNTFYGLEKVYHLELIDTNIQRWANYAFSGLKSMKTLNASYGKLENIDYYAFTETGNIKILDFSYNRLQSFNVKLLPNTELKELYLNNNQIISFSKKIFEGLGALIKINLSNNNLYTFESLAFTAPKSLSFINLFYNPDLKLGGNVFDNLNELNTVLMRNVSNQITFESSNISIIYLDISSNRISNVSLLQVHNLKKLTKLDLAQNNITILDKFSFGDITHLSSFTFLNLSDNNIKVINAGTFLKANFIMYLDLSYNKLDRIQFGAFNGLNHLHTLDLSNNALFSFKMTLLYNMPSVSNVLLDNNNIYNLGLTDNIYNLQKLSVGGNDLTCDDLVDLKMNKILTITSRVLDFYTENVDGIVCTAYVAAT